ncbi:xanthine dehydrogenase family protein subunit M [Sphingomonas koreensis]|nr:xanthine dehydrogenase family protein subunit M [Sphingomonas koreensis]
MRPFAYTRVSVPADAVNALAPDALFLAGGTNLLDLMKEGVERPTALIDVTRLDLSRVDLLEDGALSIGALAKNSDTANHPLVRVRHPLLSQAILAGASAQIRNMATVGGNLNQRTRCPYFYEPALPCNKRVPGTGCSARDGINRGHAIFGWSDACIATHPSDMCVALAALDATVAVLGRGGERREIAFSDYHRLPGDAPERDNTLQPGEFVMSVTVPGDALGDHCCYLKVRERTSYAFALVSVAAALELRDDVIATVRLAMGGVAHKPWRAFEAERLLQGQRPSTEVFAAAADAEMAGASPLPHNGYKVALGRRLIVRALETALRGTGA